jgi:hypothetical protein
LKVDQETWVRWQTWIKSIKTDLGRTVNDRAIFREFLKVVRENSEWIDEHRSGRFCAFVVRCYVARTVLGIRRHVKLDKDSISLARLLQQMREGAKQVTFEFYTTQFPIDPNSVPWQEVTYRSLSEGGKVLSQEVIEKDERVLQELTATIEAFADRALAHIDKRGFEGTLTFAELDRAIDAFDQVVARYIAFITGDGYDSLEAVVQYDWVEVFRHPLIRPR